MHAKDDINPSLINDAEKKLLYKLLEVQENHVRDAAELLKLRSENNLLKQSSKELEDFCDTQRMQIKNLEKKTTTSKRFRSRGA